MEIVLAALALLQDGKGSIKGRVSPEAAVRIVAKLAQTDASKPENVKGEVTLAKGGEFEIKGLPPGKYDLLFELQGEDKKKWIATRWSEIEVEAGKAIEGIGCRLTPVGAPHAVDELILSFKPDAAPAERAKAIADLGCRVKSRGARDRFVVVDLPDDKSVAEMAEAFRKLPVVATADPNGISRIK
jgi:hypothetical protein